MRNSDIGGQAVMEGVMMRNGEKYAVAVRKPNNDIVVETREYHRLADKYKIANIPIIRGVIAFVESMVMGINMLMLSADYLEEDEKNAEDSQSGEESLKNDSEKKKPGDSIAVGLTVMIAIVVAVGVFMILPYYASRLLAGIIASDLLLALIEGVIRMVIFVLYVVVISQMEDIKRVFMYHGAEHKSINCIENGLPLTVENAKKQSREHKRCGTSFLLYVMIISIIFFAFVRVESQVLRVVLRLLLVPVIAGAAYEFIKLAGRSNSKVMAVLSRPGFWLQGLTTREPDDAMLEVAICSVEAVFDWKAFLEEGEGKEEEKKKGKKKKGKNEKGIKEKGENEKGIKEKGENEKNTKEKSGKRDSEKHKALKEKAKVLKVQNSEQQKTGLDTGNTGLEDTDKKAEDSPVKTVEPDSKKDAKKPENEEGADTPLHKARVLKTGTRGHGRKKVHSFYEELNQMDFAQEHHRPERRLNEEEFDVEEENDEILSKLDRFFEEQEQEQEEA